MSRLYGYLYKYMLICSLKKKKKKIQWANVQRLSLGIFRHSILRTKYFSMCARFQVFVWTSPQCPIVRELNPVQTTTWPLPNASQLLCLLHYSIFLQHVFSTLHTRPKKKNKTQPSHDKYPLGPRLGGGEGWLGDLLVHLLGCQGNGDCAVVVSSVFSEWGTRDYRKYDMTFSLDQTAFLLSAARSLIFTF